MVFSERRWKHFVAMALIGDGVMAVVRPQHDARAWQKGPRAWKRLMGELHDRPALTRMVGILQVAGGVWWALRQEKADS